MERGKTGTGRGSKSKIAQHPADLFALGSKSSRSDNTDSKRPGNIHGKAGPSSSSSISDRKKEAPAGSLQSMIPAKKPKLSTLATHQRPATTSAEAWEVVAIDCDPPDLVPLVLEANDNDEGDKVIGLICGAIRILKNQRWKPDTLLYMGLMYLAKIRSSIFSNDCILHALSSLLKRDQTLNFKSKGNPLVPVLAANLLMRGFHEKKNWPEVFVKLYIEDALGDRVWIDNEECKGFVENILTGFNTRIPPKSVLQLESNLSTPRDSHSPMTIEEDENGASSLQLSSDKDKTEFSVSPRYAHCVDNIEQIILEVVKEQLNRRQPDSITRNFLKLLSSTCGFGEIRYTVVSRLEMWMHNPKISKPAQELLVYVCYNCTTHTQKDVEIISQLVKMRLKSKNVINLYLNGVKELISLHPDNLLTILKYTLYNELSASRNPNNMSVLGVIFQSTPEVSAKYLAEIFLDLLVTRDDYLRPLRTLLREIIRVCRQDLNLLTFAKTLMADKQEIAQQMRTTESKDRIFTSIVELLSHCIFLGISPQVKEFVLQLQRDDKKRDMTILIQFQKLVAMIQHETVLWLQSTAPKMYGFGKDTFLHALQKILFLEPLDLYFKGDNWPQEQDKIFYMRLVSDVPLLQCTLMKLLWIGLSKESGITHPETLELVDQLIRRAAGNSTEAIPTLQVDNINIFDMIFNHCTYQARGSANIPVDYHPPSLAISNLYWKGWTILLILAAHNPTTIGNEGWEEYPILKTLMEMCITNHFSYPPPTMALPEIWEEERAKELQVEALEKQEILEYEAHLAGTQMSEQTSLLLSQLITMDPKGNARRPPPIILEQIQSLNSSHQLGHLLCRSREPDFLLKIIRRQQQSSSQSMPWLADLVQNSEGSLSQLPVQCLCEYLLSTCTQTTKKQKELLEHLQDLLKDPSEDKRQHVYEVLEYFLKRLGSQQTSSRVQAITGLKLVLSLGDEPMEVDNSSDTEVWLLQKLPSIPHFNSFHETQTIRSLVASKLRGACLVENNPELVRVYVLYLAVHTIDDDITELIYLVNEISQLVVERGTILAAILPQTDNDTPQSRQTYQAFLAIFCNYLQKTRKPRGAKDRVDWCESQDLITVQWSNQEDCTIHILVVHAIIILLAYAPSHDEGLFMELLDTWFPVNEPPPKALLTDTAEPALLVPDWLKLRMIRSNVPRLVDAALEELDPTQLVLFIQSFGIPVNVMTRLLQLLDHIVQNDPASVNEVVLDKVYMAQLVNILHMRGASGGLVFMRVLELQVPELPEEGPSPVRKLLEPLPPSAMIQKQSVIQCSVKTDVPHLINRIFIEPVPSNQKMDAFRRLHKTLVKDLQKSAKESGSVILAIQHILSVLSSMQVKQFLNTLVTLPKFSCTLMRVLLLPLKKPSTVKQVVDLAKSMCLNLISLIGDVKAPILLILRDFANLQISKVPNRKELINLTQTRDPGTILENTDSLNLEEVGRKLLDVCLKQQKNDVLVEAMVKLLTSDSYEGNVKPRTGLLLDWLASVEPELIGTCRDLQMSLLFGKTKMNVKIDKSIVSVHSCRPYLLTLLTHRASWTTLYKCVNHLLEKCDEAYDPTAVLDFLWALTCNPKLWQGRDKFTPKHYIPENVLILGETQLLNLVAYLVEEAVNICNQENRNAALTRMESRLNLLLHCVSTEDKLTCRVVSYLAEKMMSTDKNVHSDMAHQFLLHLYMKIPKVICFLDSYQAKKFVDGATLTNWTGSVLDCMSHSLLTALAATPRQKSWHSKSQEFELCARKMATVHPILVLRQLPMLASSLTGRTYLDFSQFRSQHHLNLFVQVMGLLELLQPHLFNKEHRSALEDTLENYFQCFQHYTPFKELMPLFNRFVALLQAYISHGGQKALKYLQKHAHILYDLQARPALSSLRTLLAGIPIPREGEDGDDTLVIVAPTPPPLEPLISQQFSSSLPTLRKLYGDEVLSVLHEIETASSRKPAILEPIIDNIADLLVSPQGNIRSVAHNLIARVLKHRPTPNLHILAAFQRCLDSPRADVLMSALDRLPDIVLCMQEHALPLMQKVFELGVNSNVNTTPYINKSIALLNTQQGC